MHKASSLSGDEIAHPRGEFPNYVQDRQNEFLVSTAAYRGSTVFERELSQIFYSTWIYLGHESEISKPGDFKSTWIGLQPVILVRNGSNKIEAFLNMCRHRGAAVCREEYGNTKLFTCPYHAWSYSTSGALVGVPNEAQYPAGFSKDAHGLTPVPRIEVYAGLIFGSLNPNVISLRAFLGDACEHIDLWAARGLGGSLRFDRAHKYKYSGNWKFQAENVVDGYHPAIVHRSAFRTMAKFGVGEIQFAPGRSIHQGGFTRGFPSGHSTLEGGYLTLSGSSDLPSVREYVAAVEAMYGSTKAVDVLANRHIFIFPNLALMDVNIRVIQPLAHDQTDVYSYFVNLETAPADFNSVRLSDLQTRLGTVGLVGPDDIEIFGAIQTGLQAVSARPLNMSRGLASETKHPSGERVGEYSDEVPQRAFWRAWSNALGCGNATTEL